MQPSQPSQPSHSSSRAAVRLALVALATLAAAVPARAQGGMLGRIKSKAVDAASAAAKKTGSTTPASTQGAMPNAGPVAPPGAAGGKSTLPPVPATPAGLPPLAGDRPVMNTEVVDRLMMALSAETRIRAYAATVMAKPTPTADARRACIAGLVKDPNFQALQSRRAAQPWELSGHDLKDSVVNEQCGLEASSARGYFRDHAESVALGSSGLNYSQYRQLVERVVPFCDAYAEGNAKKLRVPYHGNGATERSAYVYTPGEADALAPHCAEIMREVPALEANR